MPAARESRPASRVDPMQDVTNASLSAAVLRWLAAFESALAAGDDGVLEGLFLDHAHWRDLLVFTWRVGTVSGGGNIVAALGREAVDKATARFRLDPERSAPRLVTRAGTSTIEAFFRFETARAHAHGLVRLDPAGASGGTPKAWTLFTAVDELIGFEETVGGQRPRGESYARDFRGPNWRDRRVESSAYDGREPTVLVVGGGQAGLSIGARLNQLGVDTLVIDRGERIGDNWRNRYHALTLHNQVQVNHLPYMPFPPNFPTYIPKDKLANWFEAYAEAMEINFWTGTEFTGAVRDEVAGCWTVKLRHADGKPRTVKPRHIIMATGASDTPRLPDMAAFAKFKGRVIHASAYGDAAEWRGREAMVIGTGTSGHDIAQDLYSNGAKVALVQRSPTLIVNVEPSAQIPYALYNEGRPLEECDFIAASTPLALFEQSHRLMAAEARAMDKTLLEGLTRAGFKVNDEDQTGWQFMYLTRGGGYYFNVGCSELIVERKITLAQLADIDQFVADGARLKNGELIGAELIVLATGYLGQEHLVRQLFGAEVAGRVGPIWGFDKATQELRNMWAPTGQRGLWFIAGSFAQCRIYSKVLAQQIKAAEAGLVPATAT